MQTMCIWWLDFYFSENRRIVEAFIVENYNRLLQQIKVLILKEKLIRQTNKKLGKK